MSILKTIPITLDLKRVGAQSQALPTLVEGDNGNVFQITMTDDGASLDLSSATRVICVFSKTSDGKTVEQDTEDANVSLDDYGITVTGGPSLNDTITVVSTSTSISSVTVSGSITAASVDDTDTFFSKFPDGGTFVFVYNGTSWQYGTHSVTIGGTDNNVVTVELKSGSYGAGTNNCEVQVYSGADGDILVTTANFNFKGRKGIMNDETIQSEENYPILVSLINKVSRIEAQHVLSVNGYTGDVVLTYTDVDAVPTDRTVNGIALSADITLDADDIGTDSVGVSVQDVIDNFNSLDADAVPTDAVGVSVQDALDTLDNGKASIASVTGITELKFDTFTDLSWTSSSPHSSDTDSVYEHRCSVPCSGVTHEMFSEVVFGIASAISGIYSPISECYDGGVYIWATEATNPTILSILVHK